MLCYQNATLESFVREVAEEQKPENRDLNAIFYIACNTEETIAFGFHQSMTIWMEVSGKRRMSTTDVSTVRFMSETHAT